MIKDKGLKKWQGIMLPEHIALFMEFSVDQKKVPKPELDEYDLHAIEETINMARKRNVKIEIKLWRDGVVNLRGGLIKEINLKHRTMDVVDPFDTSTYKLDDIVEVTILE